MDRAEKRIPNARAEMPDVLTMVERFGREHGCTGDVISDLSLAVDEILNNIITHGYRDGERGDICVRLDYRPGEVVVQVEDTGRPFDPLRAPPPDLSPSLQDRPLGGLGIHFIRSVMDEVAYDRIDGKNRLCLTKKLPLG